MDRHLVADAELVIEDLGELNRRFRGKTVLLTGAAGFLGSQFVHYFLRLNETALADKPCRLIAWDSYARGLPGWMQALGARSDLVLEKRDVREPATPGAVDFIVHAASIASPIYYRQHPIETMDANVAGLRHLLEHAKARPVEGFLCFSTSEIYGDPDAANVPTPETYRGFVSCTGPRACYDESKRFCETLCVNFWQIHRVPVTIVRPFNNYGPGLKISDRRVLPDLFRDVLANRNPVLLSDGRATRTFCYVADAMKGYLRALLSSHHGEPFNIGTELPEISMRALAELVILVSGKPLQVVFQRSADPHYTTDNPQRRCPSIAKARQLLGYQPRIDLREGIERTWRYYQDNPVAADR